MPEKEIIPLYRIYDIKNKKYIPEVDDNDEYIVLQSGKVARLKRLDTDNSILFTLNQEDYIVEKCVWRKDKNGVYIYQWDKIKFNRYFLKYSPKSKSYENDISSKTEHTWTIKYNDWQFIICDEYNKEIHIDYTKECEIIWNIHN